MWGSNPRSPRYKHGALTNWAKGAVVTSAGFEPAHPKIIELKSIALDHSAMIPRVVVVGYETHWDCFLIRQFVLLSMSLIYTSFSFTAYFHTHFQISIFCYYSAIVLHY